MSRSDTFSLLRIRDHASRNRHTAQQTPSAAANHAAGSHFRLVRAPPRAKVSMTLRGFPASPNHMLCVPGFAYDHKPHVVDYLAVLTDSSQRRQTFGRVRRHIELSMKLAVIVGLRLGHQGRTKEDTYGLVAPENTPMHPH